jgi:hypothetical protein
MPTATRSRPKRPSTRPRRLSEMPPFPILTVPANSDYGQVLTIIRRRWERGHDEVKQATGIGGAKPRPSEFRTEMLAQILYLAANLDEAYLEDLYRMARMCHDHENGGLIDWHEPDTRRDVDELHQVVAVLSFDPDSWLEEPTEQQQQEARAQLGLAKAN